MNYNSGVSLFMVARGRGVAADPHNVTDCPERAKVIKRRIKTELRYQNNKPGGGLHECPH